MKRVATRSCDMTGPHAVESAVRDREHGRAIPAATCIVPAGSMAANGPAHLRRTAG
jgi:hypothetical protein